MSGACNVCFKKEKTLRFCVYCRQLNAITVRDCDPIPRMDECIHFARKELMFSTLDTNRKNWWVKINYVDPDRIYFTSNHVLI